MPARLGLDDPATYPDPARFRQTLLWPLRSTALPLGPPAETRR